MSWYCLDTYNNINLAKINDFTKISNEVINSNTPIARNVYDNASQVTPSWLTSEGNVFSQSPDVTLDVHIGDIEQFTINIGAFNTNNTRYIGCNVTNEQSGAVFWFNGDIKQSGNLSNNRDYSFGVAVNDETQRAFLIITGHKFNDPVSNWYAIWIIGCMYNNVDLIYNTFVNNTQYTWQSVPSISGKNGISLLSHVRDDSILTGQDISNLTPAQVKLEGTTQISSLIANVPNGKAVKAIYAGKVDFLGIMKDNNASSTVRISVAGNNVYLASFISQKNYIGFIIDDENEVAKLSYIMPIYDPITEILDHYEMHVSSDDATEMHNIWLFIHSHIDNEDDNPENNEADEGTPDNYQPDIAITGITKPAYGAIDTGFTTMYRMSKGELQRLSNFLWTDSFVSNVKKFFNDPREIIVGLSIMPVLPDTEKTPGSEVKAGGISTGVHGLKLTDQYKLDTYGVIEVKAEKGNFLDYAPYTQVTAHLPFVGAHSLDVNDVMGKKLVLKYIFDFLTGSCVAEIDVYDEEENEFKPRYFFGGSCGIQVPSSSEDFSRMYSSILSAGATLGGALSTIATGGLTAPLLLGTASNMLSNGMNGSPTVEFSSGSGSVNGMIGCKSAYLVISRPKEKVAKDQQKYVGKPSFITRTLSSCTGYTKCLNVHLDNVPCTATERAEIERLLLDGVRISTGSTTPEYTPTTASDHGLIFLKCTSDMDVIGKSWNEEDELTVEGKLLFDQDMLTPKFVLHTNTLAYNYCYIPDFGRFYYVTKQLIKTGSETEIHLQCDVLQSWKTQILSNKAVLERSAKNSNVNAYFSDSMYWTQADKEVKTVPFVDSHGDDLVFEIPENNYILTIAGSD